MPAPRILIADDQPDVLEALRLLLKPEGYETVNASSPAAVLELLASRSFDGAIIDLNYTRDTTSGAEGLELLAELQGRDSQLPVIVMTAWGSLDIAVEAMRRGARDFVQKPWENERLLSIVRTQIELGRALRTARKLEAEDRVLRAVDRPVFIAESSAMKQVLRVVGDVGPSDANILLTGEPGTGKEVVAQTIHAVSHRSGRRMVSVNAGGLSEGVFESELFGHVRGAFTDAKTDRVGRFELADGGTLFLDEIANITTTQQSRLLRVVQTGEFQRVGSSRNVQVDVRILSATNADLNTEVEAGRFRADLMYRLNAIEIHLPPLRERREDIPPLASHFLGIYGRRYRKSVSAFDASAMRAMLEHDWPGNVREMQHAIERAVLLAQGEYIQAADMNLRGRTAPQRLEDLSLEQVEALLIRKAMARHEGNVSRTASALGLSRSALYRRLDRYGIK